MENNEQLNGELNVENNAQPTNEPKTYSEEEYQELLAKNEKLSTQLKASSKEAQYLSWVSKVAVDNSAFIKLYHSDKRQAEEVAKHFGRESKELYEAVKERYGDTSPVDMEDIEVKAEQIAERKFAQKELQNFISSNSLDSNTAFRAEFDSLMEGKEWTTDEVIKQAKRALKLTKDTATFKEEADNAKSRLAGAGITSNSRTASKEEKSPYMSYKQMKDSGSLLSKYGVSNQL